MAIRCTDTADCQSNGLIRFMKTAQDPRHLKRIRTMQALFEHSFQPNPKENIAPIIESLPHVDKHIAEAAPEWPIDKIAKIDLAILRLGIWELTFDKKEPPKVIVDEAVELAKSFGNEHSAKFINGVLGTVMKTL